MPKHIVYNSETNLKSKENDFFEPQNGQNTGFNLVKSTDFCVQFRYTSSIFDLWVLKEKIKIVPPES